MLEHILLPLDGSTLAESVLPHAIALTAAFKSKLTLLRVVYAEPQNNQRGIVNPIDWQIRKSEAEAYLQSVQSRLSDIEIDSDIRILEGKPADQIVEFANNEKVDLVLLTSHGKSGPSAWNINSTVQKVLLRTFSPVMLIRAYMQKTTELQGLSYERLLIPLDGSKRAECILPMAKAICKAHGSKVFLIHIIEEPKLPRQTPLSEDVITLVDTLRMVNTEEAEKYLKGVEQQFEDIQVESIIESSEKPTVTMHDIVDRENIDLVLMSAHGYSGENRWPYGKFALNFIVYGTTPLFIVQDLSRDELEKSIAEKYAEQTKGH